MDLLMAKIREADMDGMFTADVLRIARQLPTLALTDNDRYTDAERQMHRATRLIAEATGLHPETILDLAMAMAELNEAEEAVSAVLTGTPQTHATIAAATGLGAEAVHQALRGLVEKGIAFHSDFYGTYRLA